MPAQAGTQFFSIRCEIRWVPACAGMTETNHSWFESGSYFAADPNRLTLWRIVDQHFVGCVSRPPDG
jgi:hypothetical protein